MEKKLQIGKKFWFILVFGLLMAMLLAGCNDNGGTAGGNEQPMLTCMLEIRCDELVDNAEMTNEDILPYIPEDGLILSVEELEIAEGSSVFDALKSATMEQKIPLDFDGTFVKGINNIYGGEIGDMSGWVYTVNDKSPNVASDAYVIQNGDKIVWTYSAGMAE